jgi:hypothetical protein
MADGNSTPNTTSGSKIDLTTAFNKLLNSFPPDKAGELLAEGIDDGTVTLFYRGRRFTRQERTATGLKVHIQQGFDGKWRCGIPYAAPSN